MNCRIAAVLLAGSLLAGCGGANEAEKVEDPHIVMAGYQVIAKGKMEENLRDPESAKYKNVHGYRVNLGEGDQYVFCGQVNAKNAFGGYAGYEDFVAAAGIAATRSQVSDFDTIKTRLCALPGDMGEVAF
jgi:hypothetical protein